MSLAILETLPQPRLKALLDHFALIDDPREAWRVAHPLPEVLLLVVCGTICGCDDYDPIADWGEDHLDVLRRYAPCHDGVPCGRWLTLLMNRIAPGPVRGGLHGLGSRHLAGSPGLCRHRRQDLAPQPRPGGRRAAAASGFGLCHHDAPRAGHEAVPDKASETTAIPLLIDCLAAKDRLKGALVSIDAIATNPAIAGTIRAGGAH